MKKTHELTFDKTISFAEAYYTDRKTLVGEPLIAHCKNVAYLAETIGQKLYSDVRAGYFSDSTKDGIATIIHGALLHDIFHVGACPFEHVAETTTVQIAAIVADISRDFRLVETKRDMEFRGRLSQSPVASQIIATADIICTAKDALRFLKDTGLTAAPKVRKILTQLDGDLLAVHAASKYYALRLYVHAARNLLTDISQYIKTCKQQAKMARILASNAKAVTEKLAAKEAETKKNGRKKSRSSNS
jgi:(p)ppGpp synthase/HD superfamily hydrolase